MASEGLGLGGPDGPLPGLDKYRQSSTADEGGLAPDFGAERPACNPDGLRFVNVRTGVMVWARCGRLRCAYCIPLNARRRSAAIAWANPQRAITITLLAPAGDSDPWQTARRRWNRTREYLKRAGVDPGESVLHVEPNPRGTGFHGHVWQRGARPIPKAALQEAAHRAGAGWSRIERCRSTAGASAYGLKGLGYGLKGTTDGPAEYLRVNGGRLTHQSRGFFRGESVRDAERLAVGSGDEWAVCFG